MPSALGSNLAAISIYVLPLDFASIECLDSAREVSILTRHAPDKTPTTIGQPADLRSGCLCRHPIEMIYDRYTARIVYEHQDGIYRESSSGNSVMFAKGVARGCGLAFASGRYCNARIPAACAA